MSVRGIRGAITIPEDSREEIISASKWLVEEMVKRNGVDPAEIASVLITTTEDIKAAFPAQGARLLEGWEYVPLMHAQEIPVPGSLPLCIRVMMLVNTDKAQRDIHHVYLRDAVKLRPDLANR
ncbi:chorismate mutase [Brevibacillus fulvus]|uniref:chorismate mutase n=1 Tax=Brevibacillus fulvus TaxID=1125967 RepID=A0A938XZE7_9BACL|nr:chorismate mutase [Brevibacillus fulvus]MBM7588717.1 chorismate mutase [Brevibacillus fulvus]